MNVFKKSLAVIFAIILLVTLSMPLATATNEAIDELEQIRIPIYDGVVTKSYNGIYNNGDIYLPATLFGVLAKCTVTESADQCVYKIGQKTIVIDYKTGYMNIEVLHYSDSISTINVTDSGYFISASELLPWLNVTSKVTDAGVLWIIPDTNCLWKILDQIDMLSGSLFDVTFSDGSLHDTLTLNLVTVFDTVVNVRFDRLLPPLSVLKDDPMHYLGKVTKAALTGGSNLLIFKDESAYDYKCYVQALSEFAVMDESYEWLSEKEGQLQDIFDLTDGLGSIEEYFKESVLPTDAYDEFISQWKDSLYTGSLYGDVIAFQNLVEKWKELQNFFDSYEKASKFIDIFSILKMYELISKANSEYREFVSWVSSSQDFGNRLLNRALKTTAATLDKERGVLEIYRSLGINIVENIAIEKLTVGIEELTDGAFSSFTSYLLLAKSFYKVAFAAFGLDDPIESFENVAQINIFHSIQDSFVQMSNQLKNETMTIENVQRIHQSLLIALKASRKCNDAFKQLLQAFPHIAKAMHANSEYYQNVIKDINDNIFLLSTCASANILEHDSVEGKAAFSENLKTRFSLLRSKDLVTEAYSLSRNTEAETVDWHIPQINISGKTATQINIELSEFNYENICDDLISNGYNYNTASYFWAINNDVLSLVFKTTSAVRESDDGFLDYKVYNLSVEADDIISNENLYSRKGFTASEFYERVRQVLASDYWQWYGIYRSDYASDKDYYSDAKDFNRGLEMTLSSENVNSSLPYLNTDNQLCVIGGIYSLTDMSFHYNEYNLDAFTANSNYSQGIDIPTHIISITEDEAYNIACKYWDYTPGDTIELDEGEETDLSLVSDGLIEANSGKSYYGFRLRWLVYTHYSTIDMLWVDAETGECVAEQP